MKRADELRELVIDAMSWAETFDGRRVGSQMAADILDRYLAARDAEVKTYDCETCGARALCECGEPGCDGTGQWREGWPR